MVQRYKINLRQQRKMSINFLWSRQPAPNFIVCAERLHCYRWMGKELVSCHLPSGGCTILAVPVLPIRQIISPWGLPQKKTCRRFTRRQATDLKSLYIVVLEIEPNTSDTIGSVGC